MPLALALCFLLVLLAPVRAHAAEPPIVGVYAEDGLSMEAAVRDAAAATQAQHGVQSVRLPLTWRLTEPHKGRYDWSRMDEAVAAAARHGITVFPFVFDSPEWASGVEPEYGDAWPPRDPADYARFVAAAVRRYGPDGTFWRERRRVPPHPIRAWEVWNEPNLKAFWGPAPDPAAYAALLRAASEAIRAADPQAEVVMAGLPQSASGIRLAKYLKGLYAAGAKGAFDALNVHPYAPEPYALLATIDAARRVAARHGDGHLPTWVTEFGWASAGEDSIVTADERRQAVLIKRSVRLLRRVAGVWNIRGMHYFNWADPVRPPHHRDIWAFHTGLVRVDGSPKPALGALARAYRAPVAEVAGSPARPPRKVRVAVQIRSVRRAIARRRALRVHLRCRRQCTTGLALVARVPRKGRAPRRHVAGRWTRTASRKGRTARLRVSRAEAAWVRRHRGASLRLRATGLTRTGAIGGRERSVRRR